MSFQPERPFTALNVDLPRALSFAQFFNQSDQRLAGAQVFLLRSGSIHRGNIVGAGEIVHQQFIVIDTVAAKFSAKISEARRRRFPARPLTGTWPAENLIFDCESRAAKS